MSGLGAAIDLEPHPDDLRRMVQVVTERVIAYIASLPTQPAYDPRGAQELRALVDEPLPEQGTALDPLLALLFERLIPKGVNTASPGSLSYVTGGGLVHAAIAELIVGATNRYVGYWGGAPGLAEVEAQVLRWFCDLVGLPASSGGVLLTGGSMANLTAIVTARRELLGEELAAGTLYASDQMHHSVEKSAMIAGLPSRNLRVVPTDSQQRIRVDTLRELIAADKAEGRRPFCLVASAGTTNTGAVDDLPALAVVAREQGLWLHVDASYGGFFLLTNRGRRALRGIEAADSVALDPHKSLFLPFGTGCLLVRELEALRRAHDVPSDYVAQVAAIGDDAGAVNFADLSAEQSREARGVRIWLPLKLLGAGAFRRALDEKLDLALVAAEQLRTIPSIEIVSEPQLSILAFRAVAPDLGDEEIDELNVKLLDSINRPGPVHLSATTVKGRFVIRICVLPFRTHRETIDACITTIRHAVAEALGGLRGGAGPREASSPSQS